MAGRRPRALKPVAHAVVLDAEGVSKAARGDRLARAWLVEATRRDTEVLVSSVSLAETLRGGPRDAPVHRLLASVTTVDVTPEIGRSAGELLGATARDDTVDAVVAATAIALRRPVVVLTSDPVDLAALTAEVSDVSVRTV